MPPPVLLVSDTILDRAPILGIFGAPLTVAFAIAAGRPRSRPADALQIAEPLAHLAYAVRYQEFLDNIEPTERIYHLGDPAAAIRHALASTAGEGGP